MPPRNCEFSFAGTLGEVSKMLPCLSNVVAFVEWDAVKHRGSKSHTLEESNLCLSLLKRPGVEYVLDCCGEPLRKQMEN